MVVLRDVVLRDQHVSVQGDLDALKDYISQGPLLEICGISARDLPKQLQQWQIAGAQLAKQLKFDHDNLTDAQRQRIYHYYLPVYFWCLEQLEAHKQAGRKEALVVGISAPQGCGKTTLVEQLEGLFNWHGNKAASISIDDFYLTFQDQQKLASSHPDNKLLQFRGNAGTHDLALGTQTLETLRELTQPGAAAPVPRYDKSQNAGRGDRADPSTWPSVEGPLDIVLFEGWMLGFNPLPSEQEGQLDPSIAQVNQFLNDYQQAWDSYVDVWLVIKIGEPQWVYKWRLEAEERMLASGKTGMTQEQIMDFVSRFMPAYQTYLPGLYTKGPTTSKPGSGKTLMLEVDQNRAPVQQQPAPVA